MTNRNEIHFDGKVAQKAVIVRDGKVLVMRDPREKEEIWEIPGGRLNTGEDPKAGLAREIKEELGLDCVIGEVIHLAQFFQHSEQKNALMIAYEAIPVDTNAPLVLEEGEVSEIRYISQTDMRDLKFFPEYLDTLKIYFAKQSS
jgi:ADP-ribose pyrophosphatase YjhB (NUDIX family)